MSSRNLGQLIRGKREEKRLSLVQTAELCGLSDRGLLLIELGDVDPKLSSLIKIATVLEIYLGDVERCKETEVTARVDDPADGS